MVVKLFMPSLSPTMTEGLLAKWHKKEGDSIKIGDLLADIGTDKATMEFESIYEGQLYKIFVESGTENVPVNNLIALILEEGDDKNAADQIINSHLNPTPDKKIDNSDISVKITENQPAKFEMISLNKIAASPLARKIAEQNNLSLEKISGSGPNGRIIKNDILDFLDKISKNNDNLTSNNFRNPTEYTKIINNNMRKIIAQRLSESKREIPHFYLEVECEMDKLNNFRKELNSYYEKSQINHKISVNDFIIKATSLALKQTPLMNASWTDEAVLQYNNVDVAVAVAIESGLITPIIRNADMKTITQISETMKDLTVKARNSTLKPEEFQGGSFTITNLGMFGIDNFKAIINPPQAAILAVGASNEKPIVKNGEIIISSIMKVTISCDHRVIDGAVAAKFLNKFKDFMENPNIMLAI